MDTYLSNKKVLYVDDEASLLSTFSSLFRRQGLEIQTLANSPSIDAVLEKDGPFAVVISDQRMPGLDGVATLERVRLKHPDTIRVMLTGFSSMEDTQRAINQAGIYRYMTKPWEDTAFSRLVHDCVTQYNLSSENKHLSERLLEQNKALAELLEGTVGQSIQILTHLISYINPDAANQTERVRNVGRAIVPMLTDLSAEERWAILRAFDLFNFGIALLPPWIQVSLNKNGLKALTRIPVAMNHHVLAADLIKDIPRFSLVAAIIRLQRKDMDGNGPPDADRISGTKIPVGARLLHILVDLDTISTATHQGRDVLHHMKSLPNRYDTELISKILLQEPSPESNEIKMVALQYLEVGMVLVDDIVSTRGKILLRSSSIITKPMIKILNQMKDYSEIKEPIKVLLAVSLKI
jgi:response regulator RpfG family c-di-GMP phosphodiesterase